MVSSIGFAVAEVRRRFDSTSYRRLCERYEVVSYSKELMRYCSWNSESKFRPAGEVSPNECQCPLEGKRLR